jgi:hypothetical protein
MRNRSFSNFKAFRGLKDERVEDLPEFDTRIGFHTGQNGPVSWLAHALASHVQKPHEFSMGKIENCSSEIVDFPHANNPTKS